jgi:periodic tryptophan protein 2
MSLSYNFTNLCGAPYEGGGVVFTPDGNSLAAPCGNRVAIYDLQHNKVVTLPFEARQNIQHLLFAIDAPILLTIDESGRCLIINFIKGAILNRINFKSPVSDARFSPCGKFLAVASDRILKIWKTPTALSAWQLSLHRKIGQHVDRIVIS